VTLIEHAEAGCDPVNGYPDAWSVPGLIERGLGLEQILRELGQDPVLWKAAYGQWLDTIIEDEAPFAGLADADGVVRFPSADAFERPLIGELTSAGAVAALFALTDRVVEHEALLQEALDALKLDLDTWKAQFLDWLGLILRSTGMLHDVPVEEDGSVVFPSEAALRAAVGPRLTSWGALASLLATAQLRGGTSH
jgi:hypothetical protein